MNEITQYPPLNQPEPDRIAKSVERDSAFSKPGSISKAKGTSKGWKPAHGTRFRPTNEKVKGRPRKKPRDPRNVQFY